MADPRLRLTDNLLLIATAYFFFFLLAFFLAFFLGFFLAAFFLAMSLAPLLEAPASATTNPLASLSAYPGTWRGTFSI